MVGPGRVRYVLAKGTLRQGVERFVYMFFRRLYLDTV